MWMKEGFLCLYIADCIRECFRYFSRCVDKLHFLPGLIWTIFVVPICGDRASGGCVVELDVLDNEASDGKFGEDEIVTKAGGFVNAFGADTALAAFIVVALNFLWMPVNCGDVDTAETTGDSSSSSTSSFFIENMRWLLLVVVDWFCGVMLLTAWVWLCIILVDDALAAMIPHRKEKYQMKTLPKILWASEYIHSVKYWST